MEIPIHVAALAVGDVSGGLEEVLVGGVTLEGGLVEGTVFVIRVEAR
jgi:hypothetical protein